MKKKSRRWLTILIVAFLGIIGLNFGHVHADDDDDYEIDQMNVNVKVLSDGNVEVTRSVLYYFYNNFHGIYYQQELPGKGASNVGVDLDYIDDNLNQHRLKVPVNNSGKNNTCKVVQNNNLLKFKIYHKVSDNDLTVTYRYIIHGAVTNYKDAARLNWKIIGSQWDVPLHDVSINISFPSKVPGLKKYTWCHSLKKYKLTFGPSSKSIRIYVPKVSKGSFVEIDTLFPTTVTKNNENKININMVKMVLLQEKWLAFKKKLGINTTSVIVSTVMWLIVIIFIIVIQVMYRGKKYFKYPKDIGHNFDIPKLSVPIVQSISRKGSSPTTDAFTGYVLSLVRDKKISISKVKTGDYRITVENKKWFKNSHIEDAFFKKIILTVGKNKGVNISEIKRKANEDRMLGQEFLKWKHTIVKQVEKLDIFDKNKTKIEKLCLCLMAFYLICNFIIGIYCFSTLSEWILVLMPFFLLLGYYCYFRFFKSELTLKGVEQYKKVVGFKKMLKDISNLNTADVDSMSIWEDILPYAVSFGCAKQVADKLGTDFENEYIEQELDFCTNFNIIFSEVLDLSMMSLLSSDSNSSNNFGSSGGFGGGSGGGAF